MEEKHEKGAQNGAKIHVNYMIFRFFLEKVILAKSYSYLRKTEVLEGEGLPKTMKFLEKSMSNRCSEK